jgi:5-methylcytosine-specific restriction enzyme A
MAATNRIPENELVLPSLFLMKINNGHITTEELIPQLREIMKPTGEDLVILDGRSDDKFSQKVRNLKSHGTFERLGYAKYENGMYSLSDKGDKYLQENQDILKYLLINDFAYVDVIDSLKTISSKESTKQPLQVFDENIIIQEGMKIIIEKEVYTRSKQLRDYALNYYEKQEGLNCTCCGFNFSDFYGKEIGDGFIEMHHIKPVFQYQGDDLSKTIKDAISNIVPLCSNCHRMIHRHGKQLLQIELLIKQIKKNGIFPTYR